MPAEIGHTRPVTRRHPLRSTGPRAQQASPCATTLKTLATPPRLRGQPDRQQGNQHMHSPLRPRWGNPARTAPRRRFPPLESPLPGAPQLRNPQRGEPAPPRRHALARLDRRHSCWGAGALATVPGSPWVREGTRMPRPLDPQCRLSWWLPSCATGGTASVGGQRHARRPPQLAHHHPTAIPGCTRSRPSCEAETMSETKHDQHKTDTRSEEEKRLAEQQKAVADELQKKQVQDHRNKQGEFEKGTPAPPAEHK